MRTSPAAAVDLYWIPLGAGGHSVRFNGRVYEALAAARGRRRPCDLYHSALVVELDGERYAIEIAPSPDAEEASRGVVATGAVGSRWAGWLRVFRYEVRCWRGGSIPDLASAVGGPCRLSGDIHVARRLLALVAAVPTPVWGRDELKAGEMWNSNSMIAWLVAGAGLPTEALRPPGRGRAPGWDAGLEVAGRGSGRAWSPRRPTRGIRRGATVVAADCRGGVRPDTRPAASPKSQGALMSRYMETAEDTAAYVLGGALFWVVASITAAIMAVGFVAMTAVERLFHNNV